MIEKLLVEHNDILYMFDENDMLYYRFNKNQTWKKVDNIDIITLIKNYVKEQGIK